MKKYVRFISGILAGASVALPLMAADQKMSTIPPSLVTPDRVETRIGTLEFKDGVPNRTTAEKAYDNLDFTYAFRVFMDTMRGVSIHALRKGMQDIGVKANEVPLVAGKTRS